MPPPPPPHIHTKYKVDNGQLTVDLRCRIPHRYACEYKRQYILCSISHVHPNINISFLYCAEKRRKNTFETVSLQTVGPHLINIDYYMAFFISYPLSAQGYDIRPRVGRHLITFSNIFYFDCMIIVYYC